MIEQLMNDYGGRLFIAIAGVGLGFLCLIGVLLLLRRRNGPSPFLRGGKNRQPRLQVLDAAAVDARRRIVLVRRDDVEHLVMIGGPTDIVIESGIRSDGAQMVAIGDQNAQPSTLAAPPPAEPRLQAPPRQLSAPPEDERTVQAIKVQTPEPAPRAEPRPAVEPRRVEAVQRPLPRRAEPPVASPSQSDRVEPPAVTPAPEFVAVRPQVDKPDAAGPVPHVAQPAEPQGSPTSGGAAPDIGAANDALDAARRRVFQPIPENAAQPASAPVSSQPFQTTASHLSSITPQATPASTVAITPAGTASARAVERPQPRQLGSDFDRILEEEMANNLAMERDGPEPASAAPALPARDPAQPRVTGATPDPSLQTEIARIFGEMSVTRNDR